MRLVIVGGVAGGMSCAARARRLNENAEIIVLERGPDVSFAACGLPYLVGGEIANEADLLVQTPAKLKAALDLDVRIGHDVIAIDPLARTLRVRSETGESELTWDALVLAPGAEGIPLPIPGADSPRVRQLRTIADAVALRDSVRGGARRAVVIGGGFIGLEAAENLRQAGLEVRVIEAAPHILPPLESEIAALARDELSAMGIVIDEGDAVERIEPGQGEAGDVVVLGSGEQVHADVIVSAIGVRPATGFLEGSGVELARGAIVVDERGRTSAQGVWAVGDAVASVHATSGAVRPVALAAPANRAGRLAADDVAAWWNARGIEGGVDAETAHDDGAWTDCADRGACQRVNPRPLGTSIVRVGDLEVAMTGANRRDLEAAGIAVHSVHLHPTQHVTYFPGAKRMALVVHMGQDGEILGAQGAGPDGVARRIDVIATAIRGGLSVPDLVDLDLAYAPPFGAAKDAVQLAGMIGQNILEGTLKLWYPWEIGAKMADELVLDVRSAAEFSTGHIPGALSIAHTELRDRLDEVRKAANGRAVAVHCQSGLRSYLAHRVLEEAGFESASLSGGMLTLRAWLGDRVDDVVVTD